MKILVLGSNGMLGQMVEKYFSQHYEVYVYNSKYSMKERLAFLSKLKDYGECVIINCIGKIKQKSSDPVELFLVNTLLPSDLANNLGPGQILIQPSTDCVFSGNNISQYSASDVPNAVDDYGWSKALGERAILGKDNCYLIRVSIIGPDSSNSPSGLLGWFLSNKERATLHGFTNHYWNGITTLEWCKQVEKLVIGDHGRMVAGQVIQLGTKEIYSKYELLCQFQSVYNTNYIILPDNECAYVNRCLIPDYESVSIIEQLIDLKNF